jgi:hypothetical protein
MGSISVLLPRCSMYLIGFSSVSSYLRLSPISRLRAARGTHVTVIRRQGRSAARTE